MGTNQEFMAKFLQAYQEYQKNLTTPLEPQEWLKPYLSVGKKKKKNGFKSEVVGEAKTSLHDESLTEPQVDFLDVYVVQ
jgi:hypothetical protein